MIVILPNELFKNYHDYYYFCIKAIAFDIHYLSPSTRETNYHQFSRESALTTRLK